MNHKIIKQAFHVALPIMTSYFFMSITYGLMMQSAGFGWYYSLLVSMVIYTGAYQFVFISMLQSMTPLYSVALTALFMNSRNAFYVLPNAYEYKQMGKKALYMVHTLGDETFAADTYVKKSQLEHKHDTMFDVHVLARLSWMSGSVIGGVAGSLIPFDLTGIDFCMTAMFITIFIDQWRSTKEHFPQLLGLLVAVLCFYFLGSNFMLWAMMIASLILLLDIWRKS